MERNKWQRTIDAIHTEICDGCMNYCEMGDLECEYKKVLDALEKQNPKKPHNSTCPECGADANDENGHKEYCSKCGQKLDWEGHHGRQEET